MPMDHDHVVSDHPLVVFSMVISILLNSEPTQFRELLLESSILLLGELLLKFVFRFDLKLLINFEKFLFSDFNRTVVYDGGCSGVSAHYVFGLGLFRFLF